MDLLDDGLLLSEYGDTKFIDRMDMSESHVNGFYNRCYLVNIHKLGKDSYLILLNFSLY